MRNIRDVFQPHDIESGTRMGSLFWYSNLSYGVRDVGINGSFRLGFDLFYDILNPQFHENFTWLIAYQTKEILNEKLEFRR